MGMTFKKYLVLFSFLVILVIMSYYVALIASRLGLNFYITFLVSGMILLLIALNFMTYVRDYIDSRHIRPFKWE